MEKINKKFEKLPQKMFKTITFDQGSEFADHEYRLYPNKGGILIKLV
ncbi:hypothetical protein lpbnt_03054 [Legionella pneumophila]|nr:hypothetical protein lpbnt_03054 [Legionella pneumophila]GAN22062.1 hypothetical protein lpofk_03088 [Legionella pneumophila]